MIETFGWFFKTDWMESTNSWTFFDNQSSRTSLVYGRNGSGKTTFSESVHFYKGSDTKNNYIVSSPLDKNGQIIENDDLKKNIYVFNESFVDNEIGFKTDAVSLNPIVMFGDSKKIDEEIDVTKSELELLKKQFESIDLNKYIDPSNVNCLDKAKKVILSILKQHWANRNKDIKGNKTASPVKEDLIGSISGINLGSFKYNEKLNAFNKKLEDFKNIRGFSEQISEKINFDSCDCKNKVLVLQNLLGVSINKPITDELESKILKELENSNLSERNDFNLLLNTEMTYCPCCFQPVSIEHKLKLKEAFNKVIGQEAKNHISDLQKIKLENLAFDFSYLENKINIDDEKNKLDQLLQFYNKFINSLCDFVQKKINNPYDSINIDIDDFIANLNEISKEITLINSKIDIFNQGVLNSNTIQHELINENLSLAAFETLDARNNYCVLQEKQKAEEQMHKELDEKIREKKSHITNLHSRLNNTSIAIKEINNDLTAIFGKNKSLELYIDDQGNYRIKSHNRKVKLASVSVGERNAIAISYFFSLLKQNEKQGEEFTNPLFIVIDDPISSFDRDNKFGVLSLLQINLIKILQNNSSSKIVFLTHDLMTMNYMAQKLKTSFYTRDNNKSKNKPTCFVINDSQKLIKMNSELSSDYISWMTDIYNLASGNDEIKSNVSRLNEMRRILEAYSTFNYGCGTDYLINEIGIQNKINNPKLKKYFESYVLRMSLNSGSHSKEFIQFEEDGPQGFNFNYCYDEKEHAKDFLCLLYSLDSLHIPSILTSTVSEGDKQKRQEEIIENLNMWLDEIENSITLEEKQ